MTAASPITHGGYVNDGTEFHLHPDQLAWIDEMTTTYKLPDKHKALRIILQFVLEEGDRDQVFTEIRCANC